MTDDIYHLPRWFALHYDACVRAGRALLDRLPKQVTFAGVEPHALGDQHHLVACFDAPDGRFALIPGGMVELGYDRERPFVPSEAQLRSWEDTQEEYGVGRLEDFLDGILTPHREVYLPPFLIETTVPPYHGVLLKPGIRLRSLTETSRLAGGTTTIYRNGLVTVHQADRTTTYRPDGSTTHKDRQGQASQGSIRYDAVVEHVARQGYRLPSADEWEYVCAAGSRTLFRWGDDCPLDRYPVDWNVQPAWDVHHRPNAFGLVIGTDPYNWEYCQQPDLLRGGDGGCAICGGYGFLAGWLPLASAYSNSGMVAWYRDRAATDPAALNIRAFVRRVLPIPP